MALLRMFKTPKNQKYDYKPRYWDPKKEEMEERLGKYKSAKEGDVEAVKTRLSKGFRRGGGSYKVSGEMRSKQLFRSNMILLAVIALLIFLAYVAFKVYVPGIVNMMEQ